MTDYKRNCLHGKDRQKDECDVCPSMPTALMRAGQALFEVERAWNPALVAGDHHATALHGHLEYVRTQLSELSRTTALRAAGDLVGRVTFHQAPSGFRYVVLDDAMPYWMENGVLITASMRASDSGINWDEAGEVAFDCIDTLEAGECAKVQEYLEAWARNNVPPLRFAVRDGEENKHNG